MTPPICSLIKLFRLDQHNLNEEANKFNFSHYHLAAELTFVEDNFYLMYFSSTFVFASNFQMKDELLSKLSTFGCTHTRQYVLCPSKFFPKSPVCLLLTSASTPYRA